MGFVWEIGYAYSFDGVNWMKYTESDPVLMKGSSGSWDQEYVGLCGVVLFNDTTAKMWYAGGDAPLMGEIGYATDSDFVVSVKDNNNSKLPLDYSLFQNYPNPFNPSTNIEYSIPSESFVELKVYDILGNEVASLVNEQQQAGVYRADFTGENLPSGMYFARITANEFTQVIKMILMK
jgi:hypothetical protein